MLSKILAGFFRIGFVLVLIITILQIVSQVKKSKVAFKISSAEVTLATPGIDVNADRYNGEPLAPDTIVTYKYLDKEGHAVTAKGSLSSQSFKKANAAAIPIDSQQILILDDHDNFNPTDSVIVVNIDQTRVRSSNPKHLFGGIKENSGLSQTLRILPRSTGQYIVFILFDILKFGSTALMFFCFIRLFANFGRKEFFTIANIRMLKLTGWSILIPYIVMLILYWMYFTKFNPVKGTITNGESQFIATYSLNAGLKAFQIFTGLGIIILSHIFKNGLSLKEDKALII